MCVLVGVVSARGVWCGCVVWGDGVVVCTYARTQRTYVRTYVITRARTLCRVRPAVAM